VVWFGLNWFELVWFCLNWYGFAWFGLVWFGLACFGLVWFGLLGLVWFGLVWRGLVWFGLVCIDLVFVPHVDRRRAVSVPRLLDQCGDGVSVPWPLLWGICDTQATLPERQALLHQAMDRFAGKWFFFVLCYVVLCCVVCFSLSTALFRASHNEVVTTVSQMVVFPMDTIRRRMMLLGEGGAQGQALSQATTQQQFLPPGSRVNSWTVCKAIVQQEGFTGLFKGGGVNRVFLSFILY
jgi:hypothetical protein